MDCHNIAGRFELLARLRPMRFGVGASFKQRREHEVMDADWSVSGVTQQNKDKAWSQLGTSGSGNHFVEFGLFTTHSKFNNLEPETYVALPRLTAG